MKFRISYLVSTSEKLVNSSKIIISLSENKALHNEIRCNSPTEKFIPESENSPDKVVCIPSSKFKIFYLT